MKYLYHLFLSFFAVFVLCSSISFGRYEDFLDQLRIMDIAVDDVIKQDSISRYDLARYLNAIDCQDCINPTQPMQDKYVPTFRDPFVLIQDNNFADIAYRQAFYKEESYYHCVAYAGDNEYMNGYAVQTSPVCADQFCGERPTTKAEFLQVIVNILEQYIHSNYITNRGDIANWLDTATDYQQKWMTDVDRVNIRLGNEACGDDDCTVSDRFLFKTYLKYCSFNLQECGMKTYGNLKQGRRPLTQLNILVKQGVISENEASENNLHDPAKGEDVMRILYQAHEIIDCPYDNDYDCDGVPNNKDVCANSYDPLQRDTDGDGIGNTCDDDIDGDTIKNPIGIVDHRDSIIISKYDPLMDNCLFTKNQNQSDTDNDSIGDVCQLGNQKDGLMISVQNIQIAPDGENYTVSFLSSQTQTQREINTQTLQGQTTTTILSPGTHTILARSAAAGNDGIAKTSLYLPLLQEEVGLSHSVSPNLATGRSVISLNPTVTNTPLTRSIQSENNQNNTNNNPTTTQEQEVQGTYQKLLDIGTHTITAITRENNAIQTASQSIFSIDPLSPYSLTLVPTQTTTDKDELFRITLDTQGLLARDIRDITWNRGDGNTLSSLQTTQSYRYDTVGTFVVSVQVNLRQTSHTVFLTMHVSEDETITSATSLGLFLSETKARVGQQINLGISLQGISSLPHLITQREPGYATTIQDATAQTSQSYVYKQAGIYFPHVSSYISACTPLTAQGTIAIVGQDRCQQARADGSIENFTCDLDSDGTPDICDDDIDGDGTKNSVGLIMFEQSDCVIDSNNIDPVLLNEHLQGVCLLDNCPFVINNNQDDLNRNGYGDACPDLEQLPTQEQEEQEGDRDGDGYTDNRDACPDIAENFNGYQDLDGCPEIGSDNICSPSLVLPDTAFIDPLECNQCPCQFADRDGELTSGDDVRAVLLNSGANIRYSLSESREFIIEDE